MATAEEFAERLEAALNVRRVASCNGYLHFSHLEDAIREAAHPPNASSTEFPLMMFRDRDHRIVKTPAEEQAAAAQGFTRTASPQYEAGFPKSMIEKPVNLGGWKVWDLRGVLLHTSVEEQQFRAVTEAGDWMEDCEHKHGVRGISLDELVAERKELLKSIIDAEQLEIVTSQDADESVPNSAAESPDADSTEKELG